MLLPNSKGTIKTGKMINLDFDILGSMQKLFADTTNSKLFVLVPALKQMSSFFILLAAID